jgi:hypothetical protein
VVAFAQNMHGESRPGQRERALAELATRQHGVVSYRQLVRLGLGRGAIEGRLANGRLHRIHLGIYAVGHSVLVESGYFIAAVLAAGPGALLSHRSAAALRGLRESLATFVEVTAERSRHSRAGLRVHTARCLHPDDRDRCDGIPVTSIARTLLDLAEVLPGDQLGRVIEKAEHRGLFDLRQVEDLLARSHGRRGLPRLAAALAPYTTAPVLRSEFERIFQRFCETHGLPMPGFNLVVAGHEVDAVWWEQGLIVELDGWDSHRGRGAFERDRARDSELLLAGFRVVRITYRRLTEEPAAVAAILRRLLGI